MEQMRVGEVTQPAYEEFQPSAGWTQDSAGHVLLADLPGFKKEELKVRINLWKLTVSGVRKVNENKYSRFKKVFDIPQDSDIDKITHRFDGRLLSVILPRKITERVEKEPMVENQNTNEIEKEKKDEMPNINEENHKKNDDVEDKHDLHNEKKKGVRENQINGLNGEERAQKREVAGTSWGWGKEWKKRKEELEVLTRSVAEKICKNKAIIVTVVLVFSVGLYLRRKCKKVTQVEFSPLSSEERK